MSSQQRQRWRLILGEGSEGLGSLPSDLAEQALTLDYLYDREGSRANGTGGRGGKGSGTRDPSALTLPAWINKVRELFPARTVELIQRDALERYGLVELVTDPETLTQVAPSPVLLKAILSTKHLMNDQVLSAARHIVRKVVAELVEALRPQIRLAMSGLLHPHRRSRVQVASNFDPLATIRANLKNLDPATQRLVIREPIFRARTRRESERWQVITLVDQSGSMTDSVIHAAVTASIFYAMPSLQTHLIAFDTSVVDLTQDLVDPVETLMKVQLGGGTDIAQAVQYAESLVRNPRRTLVVLITDLYEGGKTGPLRASVARLVQSGVTVLVLGALTAEGTADWDRTLARRLSALGAQVGAMTPHDLAAWVAERVR